MSETAAVCLLLFSVFISACSQVLLKKSAKIEKKSRLAELLEPSVLLSYAIFFIAALLTTISYRSLEVSFAAVLENTGYFFVMLLSRIFLKEKISPRKWLALLLVIAGIVIFHL